MGSLNRRQAAALLASLAIAAAALGLIASSARSPQRALAQATGCPPYPSMLSPKGGRAARFTMLIRINKPENVTQYRDLDLARGQILTRDIFLVNTRFRGSSPREAKLMVSMLRKSFPCNRIIALNGLGRDPSKPGYEFSLSDSPELWALMIDWERRDWGLARGTNPSMSRWKRKFGRSLNRLRSRLGTLAHVIDGSSGPRRVGAIPSFFADWHYGRIARAIDHHNKRFGRRRGGIQVVATQASCMKRQRHAGEPGIRKRAHRIFHQYGRYKRKQRNVALQISFSDTARAKRHLPIRSVDEGRAVKCAQAALRRSAGAFLFWASPESMTALFSTARFSKLRRPTPSAVG